MNLIDKTNRLLEKGFGQADFIISFTDGDTINVNNSSELKEVGNWLISSGSKWEPLYLQNV